MDTIQYPTLIKINEMYPQMTQSQQQLATYILENPSIVVNTSITDLMSHTNFRSEASVVKFCRLLGFDGFKSFKIKLTQEYLNRTFYHSQNDITLDDTPGDIKKKVFLGAINSLNKNSAPRNPRRPPPLPVRLPAISRRRARIRRCGKRCGRHPPPK